MIRNRELSLGIVVPQGFRLDFPPELSSGEQWRIVVDVSRRIENLGFDGAWVYDHFHTFPVKEKKACLEAWTTLGALAMVTKRVRLGQMVACQGYRNPAVLAKMSSCLDVISNGRLELGIGAGWYEEEFNAYGIPYPRASVRIAQLREAVQVVKKMWTEEETTFDGRYYNIQKAFNYPKPIQRPHPPITIGGGGEKLTLKVVAEYADRWNIDLMCNLNDSKHKLQVLENHCRAAGRNFDEIEISVHRNIIVDKDRRKVDSILKERYKLQRNWFREHNLPDLTYDSFLDWNFRGTPRECVEQLRKFIDIGVSHFVMHVPNSVEITPLELIANEVKPALIRE